jgi:hypothetical protein
LASGCEQQIRLTLEELFDWDRVLKDKRRRFKVLHHKQAQPESLTLVQQLRRRDDPAYRPMSLAQASTANPEHLVSAIQVPYRLALAPIEATWKMRGFDTHDPQGRTEIWSVRAESARMRAVWSPDFISTDFWARNIQHQPTVPFSRLSRWARSTRDSRAEQPVRRARAGSVPRASSRIPMPALMTPLVFTFRSRCKRASCC